MSVGRKLWLSLYPWEEYPDSGKEIQILGRTSTSWEKNISCGKKMYIMGRKSHLVNFITIYKNSLVWVFSTKK